MAVLEDEGLITHPHTSAGRIPTDLGYRVFVDKLATVKPLSSAERRAIEAERAAAAKIQCERDRQRASNQGAVVGGVAGAVIGSQVAGSGAKSEGAVIGGLGGVLAGRQIAKKDHRC